MGPPLPPLGLTCPHQNTYTRKPPTPPDSSSPLSLRCVKCEVRIGRHLVPPSSSHRHNPLPPESFLSSFCRRATADPGLCPFQNKPSLSSPPRQPHERHIGSPNDSAPHIQIASAHPNAWWLLCVDEVYRFCIHPSRLSVLETTCEGVQRWEWKTSETTDQPTNLHKRIAIRRWRAWGEDIATL